MATARKAAAPRAPRPRTPSLPALPPITVARFEEAMRLVEQLVDEQTDVFIAKGQEFMERHRAGTERRLTAQEAAQIASAMAGVGDLPPVQVAVAVQESELRAYDEPEPLAILLRAGVATAPEAMVSVQRFVALIEMNPVAFREAREANRLSEAIDEAVYAMAYSELAGDGGARHRAQRALEHFAAAAGTDPGKALTLLPRALWQAMEQATAALGLQRGPSSLTGSPPSTDGLDAKSSTTSPTATP